MSKASSLISIYSLSIEKGTFFYKRLEMSKISLEKELFEQKIDKEEPFKRTTAILVDVMNKDKHAVMFVGDFLENLEIVICKKVYTHLYELTNVVFNLNASICSS